MSQTSKAVVTISSFLDCLEPGVSILADRVFKHIEELLLKKGINLERPPKCCIVFEDSY